jgi:hypothetical protein
MSHGSADQTMTSPPRPAASGPSPDLAGTRSFAQRLEQAARLAAAMHAQLAAELEAEMGPTEPDAHDWREHPAGRAPRAVRHTPPAGVR